MLFHFSAEMKYSQISGNAHQVLAHSINCFDALNPALDFTGRAFSSPIQLTTRLSFIASSKSFPEPITTDVRWSWFTAWKSAHIVSAIAKAENLVSSAASSRDVFLGFLLPACQVVNSHLECSSSST